MIENLIYDVTLRDGNHALRHSLSSKFVADYCSLADDSGVWAVEVGHGNGLGASSYLVGKSSESDENLLTAARENLKAAKLAIHSIPGFSTIPRDLKPAMDLGVDVFRVATHVTEATVAEKQIEFLANNNKLVHGVLMMSHMINLNGLISQVKLMKDYGASAVILMDSAGHFVPSDVEIRIRAIKESLDIDLGFHAHNNLGVAVSNAQAAHSQGAKIIDGASMGLGAGAGNAQLEAIVANGFIKNDALNLKSMLTMSREVMESYPNQLPRTSATSIESGLAGVFSGYAPQVKIIAEELGIDQAEVWIEMAKRKLVAGQESMIREIAQDLMNL
jgi:4-hydroxy 2-oxovalerate aldolase